MKMIENTKSFFGRRAINSILKSNKRVATACNIKSAKTIGIIFNATHQVSFEIVKNLVKNISNTKNNIEVLGYVDSKQLIDHYLYRKGFDFFTRNQLNWYYKPITENTEKFINNTFDLLLDLSLDNPYPIQYILACSKAKFKAGKFTPDQQYLDLMIDMEKEKATMSEIQAELEKDIKTRHAKNGDVEKIVDKKVQTEIELNFLINQLLHYLSVLKN